MAETTVAATGRLCCGGSGNSDGSSSRSSSSGSSTGSYRLPFAPRELEELLPVVDLAARLGWRATEPTARHVIIVTQVAGQFRGLIVDSVSDIVTFPIDALQSPPATGDAVIPFLEGLDSIEDRMVMVLDLPSLTQANDIAEAA